MSKRGLCYIYRSYFSNTGNTDECNLNSVRYKWWNIHDFILSEKWMCFLWPLHYKVIYTSKESKKKTTTDKHANMYNVKALFNDSFCLCRQWSMQKKKNKQNTLTRAIVLFDRRLLQLYRYFKKKIHLTITSTIDIWSKKKTFKLSLIVFCIFYKVLLII